MSTKHIEMKPPTVADIKAFYAGIYYPGIQDAMAAYIDGKVVGIAGVLRDPVYDGTIIEEHGKIIGFIDAEPEAKCLGVNAILAIRQYLRDRGREICVLCDSNNYPDAPKLLTVLGFKETSEVQRDSRNTKRTMQVWTWQR